MGFLNIFSTLVSVILFGYLLIVLFKPHWFG
ncbi:MAG: K(+)-transporting ATPase subunit F [Caldilineaceae bacterium]|nr:K(+)-transporting ATPase subunit F [Caldilineaceae bacterium]